MIETSKLDRVSSVAGQIYFADGTETASLHREEGSHSGLVRCLGKAVNPQGFRGFKSLLLRHTLRMYMYPDNYLNQEDFNSVRFFSSPYDVLNNWGANRVKVWGKNFTSAEHAYQYKKFETTSPEVAESIFRAPSPWATYQIARQSGSLARKDWHTIKLSIMEEIIRAKAQQNDDVREQLMKTGNREIIENSPWDEFWGCGKSGKGLNHLGKLWMKVRSEF